MRPQQQPQGQQPSLQEGPHSTGDLVEMASQKCKHERRGSQFYPAIQFQALLADEKASVILLQEIEAGPFAKCNIAAAQLQRLEFEEHPKEKPPA